MSSRILVTGMSGLIGGLVRRRLQDRYQLSALNRRAVPGVTCRQADIADFEAILPAFQGQQTVIHLAAIARGEASWEEALHHNLVGTRNVFEAAARSGVRRIVYASSGATVAGYERAEPYRALAEGRYDEVPASWTRLTHLSPVRPAGLYGVSKVFGEALARHYVDEHGLSIVCLRIGAVLADDRPTQPRHFSVWCSQRDIADMIERCVQAPEQVRFDLFFVTSNNRWSYRDLEHARRVVGFIPRDAAEDHRQGSPGDGSAAR